MPSFRPPSLRHPRRGAPISHGSSSAFWSRWVSRSLWWRVRDRYGWHRLRLLLSNIPPCLAPPLEQPAVAVSPAPTFPETASAPTPPPRSSNLRVTVKSPTSRTFECRETPIQVEFSLLVNQDTMPAAFDVNLPMEGMSSWPAPNSTVFTPRDCGTKASHTWSPWVKGSLTSTASNV